MSRRYTEVKTQEKHEHVWFGTLCGCGAEKVSYPEYSQRSSQYNDYYKQARQTESFALYEVMRSAVRKSDGGLIRECRQRAKELIAQNLWIKKPSFPDPALMKLKDLLVIV